MLKQHHSLDDPKTGVPSEAYKANYDRIFGGSLWRKRQAPAECYVCGLEDKQEHCTGRTGGPKAVKGGPGMPDLKIIQEVFGNREVSEKWLVNMFDVCRRVRAAEREWVGLTDDAIAAMADSLEVFDENREKWVLDPNTFARAIEAKLKEKNK